MINRRTLLTAIGAISFALSTGPSQAWEPDSPVTVVVPYGAGGGTDNVFRQLAQIINENNLSPTNWIVENRAGGGGMNGMRYVAQQEGNDHLLMAMTPGHLMVPKLQNLEITWQDMTPVANLVIDPQVLVTTAESPYSTVEEIIEALKSDAEQPRMAGGVVGQDDHLTSLILDQAIGKRSRYIAFTGGGELRQALLGGHVDAGWLNPSEMEGLLPKDGGNLVPLAVALEERIDRFPDVPTFREVGLDVVYDMFFRAVVAPGGIDDEVVEFYIGVIEEAVEQPAWKEFVAKSGAVPHVVTGDDFAAALERWDARLEELVPDVQAQN
jgi:putative tricarboxylic transport membrane protein